MQTRDAAENNQAGQWFTAVGEVAGQIGSTSNYFFVPQAVLDGPEEDRSRKIHQYVLGVLAQLGEDFDLHNVYPGKIKPVVTMASLVEYAKRYRAAEKQFTEAPPKAMARA